VTTSALFAAVAGGVFAGGAYLFIPRSWDYMPLASGVYVFAGVLCGALAGGIHATRRRTGDIVRSSYQLTSPVMELLIHSVVAEGVGRSAPSMPALATDQPRTRFGRLAQRQLLRSVRRHWASNFFEGLDAAARSPAALEQFIAERVIAVTTADLERRSRWIFYAVCAGTAAVWALPAVIAKLVRAAA
jgi:hypothetical protein